MILKIYFGIFMIGLLGLMMGWMMGGGDAEFDGDGEGGTIEDTPKIFSLRIVFTFMLTFAMGAFSMYYSGKEIWVQLLSGFGFALVAASLSWYVMKLLYGQQGNSMADTSQMIGKKGIVTIMTTNSGKAKVRIEMPAGPIELLCKEQDGKKLSVTDSIAVTGKIGALLIVSKI